jgi:flagellar basal-body rod protein FlgG
MFRALSIAATGMAAQQTNLESISNNVANANTVGYKKQRTDFQDLLYQTVREPGTPTGPTTQLPTGLQVGTGVRVVGISRVFKEGTLVNSGNPLDIAIEGSGFFSIQQADGTPAYTRAGNLQMDSEGRIVTPEGMPLDPQIIIPSDSVGVSIGATGIVTVTTQSQPDAVEVGQIQLATFTNPAGLRAMGHNLYQATQASGEAIVGEPASDGRGALLQGSLEQANVDIVEEMVGMISAQRGYEINSKVITTADDMLRAVTQLR